MALVTCPECSNHVSDKAPACPKCGYPLSDSPSAAPTATSSKAENELFDETLSYERKNARVEELEKDMATMMKLIKGMSVVFVLSIIIWLSGAEGVLGWISGIGLALSLFIPLWYWDWKKSKNELEQIRG